MIKIKRTNSDNKEFRKLIAELDLDLNGINGSEQAEYDQHNIIDYLDTVVLVLKDNKAVACGAFKEFNDTRAEIKRVFVQKKFRGLGISKKLLNELEFWAEELGYNEVILETGVKQTAAIGLYKSAGFRVIDNFGPYVNLSNSVCMGKSI